MDLPKNEPFLKVQDELRRLHEENARPKALLAQHGILWEGPITPDLVAVPQELAPVPSHFTIEDKIVPFLFIVQQTPLNAKNPQSLSDCGFDGHPEMVLDNDMAEEQTFTLGRQLSVFIQLCQFKSERYRQKYRHGRPAPHYSGSILTFGLVSFTATYFSMAALTSSGSWMPKACPDCMNFLKSDVVL